MLKSKNKTSKNRFSKFIKKVEAWNAKRNTPENYTKSIVTRILNNAIIWVYLSYILALFGKVEIAENLSIVIVKVIISTIITYCCKALIENVFKYKWNSAAEREINSILEKNAAADVTTDATATTTNTEEEETATTSTTDDSDAVG